MSRPCAIEGCWQPVQARGWCMRHYSRWRRQGDPNIVLPRGGSRAGRRPEFRRVRFTPRLWCRWFEERFEHPHAEHLAAGIRALREAIENGQR